MIRTSRVGLVHGAFVLFAIALVARAAQVQLFQTDTWRAKARRQQTTASSLPAPRGAILDASGALLVESRQLVKFAIAPREVVGDRPHGGHARSARSPDGTRRMQVLTRALARAGVTPEWVRRASDTTKAWVEIPGHFLATDVDAIVTMRGVHATPVLDRVPPATEGLRRLIGNAKGDGDEGTDGLERALDPMLRGESGHTAVLRDARGGHFDSPAIEGRDPRPGNTVVLTLHRTLQEIAERALEDAVHEMGAAGGDVVILDPQTGEVRAMASRRTDPRSTAATALTEPYEPGSTIKPFVAARILELRRGRVDEVVNVHGGTWELNGRKIIDDHPGDHYSLADVIRVSSNIGIVQFAQRLSPREEYEMMRDLGFGTQTGLPYPAESPGTLRPPNVWDAQTAVSMAMGYAVTVTPLQLATAYAAIANGGELLQPALVKEVRGADGVVRYRHARQVIRRVMSEETARTVRGLLRSVVDSGTGESASLATFDVAGKTGTAKRTEHGRYVTGEYTASFVGLFPADKPQLVILVKLDKPSKSIYGGKAAAPVSKVVLQAAIAARDASLDRRNLAAAPARAARAVVALPDSVVRADSVVREAASGSVPYVYRLDGPHTAAPAVVGSHPVPAVRGLDVRHAVYTLHRAGFRVSLANVAALGDASGTAPAAGAMAPGGSIVRLERAP